VREEKGSVARRLWSGRHATIPVVAWTVVIGGVAAWHVAGLRADAFESAGGRAADFALGFGLIWLLGLGLIEVGARHVRRSGLEGDWPREALAVNGLGSPSVLGGFPEGVLVIDGRAAEMNNARPAIAGLQRGKVAGSHGHDARYRTPDPLKPHTGDGKLWEVLGSGEPRCSQPMERPADGAPAFVDAMPTRDPKGSASVGPRPCQIAEVSRERALGILERPDESSDVADREAHDLFDVDTALWNTHREQDRRACQKGLVGRDRPVPKKPRECDAGPGPDSGEPGRIEEALRESAQVLAQAIQGNPIATFTIDMNHTVTHWNVACENLTGFSAQSMIGTRDHWRAFYHERRPIMCDLILDGATHETVAGHYGVGCRKSALVDGAYECEGLFPHLGEDGKWLFFSAAPLRNLKGEVTGAIETLKDITERKRDEQEKERIEARLRQAQKMEAVGQLAGGVAHDFNNVLQAIHGYVELVLDGLPDDDECRAFVEEIRKAANRASALTRQLLAFSRRQVLQPACLDLNHLTEDLLTLVRRLIGENIQLDFLPSGDLGAVHADPGQIEQIVINLCVNARDAMPDGGTLTIKTRNAYLGDEYCAANPEAKPGCHVLLSIGDTGVGMDEATQERMFDPFFTTKRPGRGTGLGLATVHAIVQQHGGVISVRSTLGKGTVFDVYFPLAERPAAAPEQVIPGPVCGGTETILFAEDDEALRDLGVRILERAGYTVLSAADGEEAVQLFESHAPEISLALLDVVMPKLGGRQVYDRIRAFRPDIRVLFSTGYIPDPEQTRFIRDKELQVLQKPSSPQVLLRKIREMLNAGSG